MTFLTIHNSINVGGVLTHSSSINLVPDVKRHVKFLSNIDYEPEKHSKLIGEVKHGVASEQSGYHAIASSDHLTLGPITTA